MDDLSHTNHSKNKKTFSYTNSISHPTTITIGNLQQNQLGRFKLTNNFLRTLLDTGCSNSLVHRDWSQYGKIQNTKKMKFMTGNGIKVLDKNLVLDFTLCEFTNKRRIRWSFIVDESNHGYDMIMGRDLLCELGMKLDFNKKIIIWQGMEIAMRMPENNLYQQANSTTLHRDCLAYEYTLESAHSPQATDRIQEILEIHTDTDKDLSTWVKEIPNLSKENLSQSP